MRPIDLAPKPAHMHVHEVGLWNELVLPHLSEEYFTAKYPAVATHHILKQAELSRQQINRTIARMTVVTAAPAISFRGFARIMALSFMFLIPLSTPHLPKR